MSEDKKKIYVVCLKTTDGDDILGLYMGENDENELDPSIILYRPIYIKPVSYASNGMLVNTYATKHYFNYGSNVSNIPYSKILNRDLASDFFSVFYTKSIGELICEEEKINKSYTDLYEYQNLEIVMEETDSIYCEHISEYSH